MDFFSKFFQSHYELDSWFSTFAFYMLGEVSTAESTNIFFNISLSSRNRRNHWAFHSLSLYDVQISWHDVMNSLWAGEGQGENERVF